MKTEKLIAAVELREHGADGDRLHATILTEGRAASGGRAEVFAPGGASWPATGIDLRVDHGTPPEIRGVLPVRGSGGAIQIAAKATAAVREAVQGGKRFASIEFIPQEERKTRGGVREVLKSLIIGAALTASPEFDSTAAELRMKQAQQDARRWWN